VSAGCGCRVLLLTPSRGRGGGIERYVQTLEWAFATQGIESRRIDLSRPGPDAHLRMLAEGRAHLRAHAHPTRLVAAHRALLPVASLVARDRHASGISVICHGSDVWGARFRPRSYAEGRLMSRPDVRVVAVSGFTAGALPARCPATILAPGLAGGWFGELVKAGAAAPPHRAHIQLVTAFRLADWKDKGLPQLIDAVGALGRADVLLTVCGSGEPPADLMQAVRAHGWCTLRAGPADDELAAQLAAADLFVLATRTRPGRHPSGEGFGLVLLEAQVAGTPVVAPAYGGSCEAYIEGVTGAAPADESAAALTDLLGGLLKDPARLVQMGGRAAEWARERFAPERYAALVAARLL
jgi:glycosyltransferase involved in cell wall biosynthesis